MYPGELLFDEDYTSLKQFPRPAKRRRLSHARSNRGYAPEIVRWGASSTAYHATARAYVAPALSRTD
jgi:hypothetical protein